MLESKIETHLVKRVKDVGGTAYKFTSPQRRAVPDRLVLLPGGRATFVECKATGQKPTEAQAREHTRLGALGFPVLVIDSLEAVEAFIGGTLQ
ncbi:VRR-NUC domain-containing protein [Cupriavidus sp. CuC1]|uniref:VRR-NUC domain-containing protein n=1 Tax=Cupriavidus sp. CuC1 TaxID=3373131 RepID=UPI0037D66F0E